MDVYQQLAAMANMLNSMAIALDYVVSKLKEQNMWDDDEYKAFAEQRIKELKEKLQEQRIVVAEKQPKIIIEGE